MDEILALPLHTAARRYCIERNAALHLPDVQVICALSPERREWYMRIHVGAGAEQAMLGAILAGVERFRPMASK